MAHISVVPHLVQLVHLRGVFLHLRILVSVIDVITNPDKLLPLVRASDQHDGHAHHLAAGDLGCIGRVRLQTVYKLDGLHHMRRRQQIKLIERSAFILI